MEQNSVKIGVEGGCRGEARKDKRLELIDVYGVDVSSLHHIRDASNRCDVLCLWLTRLVLENHLKQVLVAPAPILSRSFQAWGSQVWLCFRGFVGGVGLRCDSLFAGLGQGQGQPGRSGEDSRHPFPFPVCTAHCQHVGSTLDHHEHDHEPVCASLVQCRLRHLHYHVRLLGALLHLCGDRPPLRR